MDGNNIDTVDLSRNNDNAANVSLNSSIIKKSGEISVDTLSQSSLIKKNFDKYSNNKSSQFKLFFIK